MKKITLLLSIYSLFVSQNLVFADSTTTSGTYTTTTTSSSSADDTIATQKTTCESNSAKQWDTSTNRCVTKADTNSYRKDSINCNEYTDIEQRKACQLSLASSKTGVTSDANEALSNAASSNSRSTIINTANTVISIINLVSEGGKESNCTSAKILAATSIAGTLSDILMKIKIKKKGEELANKYTIDTSTGSYQAQYKALQYLKEEEETVKEIAELEKKRQMLLMIGYGTAIGFAITEGMTMNQTCTKTKEQEAKEKADAEKAAAAEKEKAAAAAAEKEKAAAAEKEKAAATSAAEKEKAAAAAAEKEKAAAASATKLENNNQQTPTAEAAKTTTTKKSYEVLDEKTGKYYQYTKTYDASGAEITNSTTVIYNGKEYSDVSKVTRNGVTYYVTGGKTEVTPAFNYSTAQFYTLDSKTQTTPVYKKK